MRSEQAVNVPAVTRFVREVIGCNCPDEVFQRIEIRRGSEAVKSCSADWELRIGGRLLIVITSEPAEVLSGRLPAVISEGVRSRNDGKFNRFRLVVQSRTTAQDEERLSRSFEAIPAKDEKTHLHVVGQGTAPEFLLS